MIQQAAKPRALIEGWCEVSTYLTRRRRELADVDLGLEVSPEAARKLLDRRGVPFRRSGTRRLYAVPDLDVLAEREWSATVEP